MAVLERERTDTSIEDLLRGIGFDDLWTDPQLSIGGTPPDPPRDEEDEGNWSHGDGNGEGQGIWGQRLLTIIGMVVLLCMIVSPVAADLLSGHLAHR